LFDQIQQDRVTHGSLFREEVVQVDGADIRLNHWVWFVESEDGYRCGGVRANTGESLKFVWI
jgi:hypothetical protein